ncbi:MAG: hypothetical protein DCC66_05495 [Planctomycetota bacterium]|nr:MAG: hypothetical protein DCC66_05495 [Planctomycetota bacterium]
MQENSSAGESVCLVADALWRHLTARYRSGTCALFPAIPGGNGRSRAAPHRPRKIGIENERMRSRVNAARRSLFAARFPDDCRSSTPWARWLHHVLAMRWTASVGCAAHASIANQPSGVDDLDEVVGGCRGRAEIHRPSRLA